LELFADLGGPAELGVLFDLAASEAPANADRVGMLDALQRAASERTLKPAGDLTPLSGLLDAGDLELRMSAIRLAGVWRLESARQTILSYARADAAPLRAAALQALVDFGAGSAATLTELTGTGEPSRRVEAAAALARLDALAAAPIVANLLSASADADVAALTIPLLRQKEGPAALAKALADRSLQPATGRALLRAISTSGLSLPELSAAVEAAARLERVVAMPGSDALAAMVRAVEGDGDAARGEQVYRRADLLCTSCHAVGGAGGRVGPDLGSIGGSATIDYLIESLLDPPARVKEGYEVVTVHRKDGTVTAGILARDGASDLVLRDGSDNVVTIPAAEIASRTLSSSSLMPPGLTAQLRRDEFLDLVKFLSLLGTTGAYEMPRDPVVRRWLVLEADRDISATLREQGMGFAARAQGSLPWRPAYSTVAGELPLAEVPIVSYFGTQRFRVVSFEIDVARPAAASLAVTSGSGLSVWIDGRSVDVKGDSVAAELQVGRHVVTVAVDGAVYANDTLRIGLAGPSEALPHVQFVSGK
jgi:putative heme-binding domain-containing protein